MSRHVLYVIELSDSVAKKKNIPPRRSPKPYIYVGQTSKRRRVRLAEHRSGERYVADRRWAKHYGRARADLWADWPKYRSKADALAGEAALAAELNERGYTVVNKTGTAIELPPPAPRTSHVQVQADR